MREDNLTHPSSQLGEPRVNPLRDVGPQRSARLRQRKTIPKMAPCGLSFTGQGEISVGIKTSSTRELSNYRKSGF